MFFTRVLGRKETTSVTGAARWMEFNADAETFSTNKQLYIVFFLSVYQINYSWTNNLRSDGFYVDSAVPEMQKCGMPFYAIAIKV